MNKLDLCKSDYNCANREDLLEGVFANLMNCYTEWHWKKVETSDDKYIKVWTDDKDSKVERYETFEDALFGWDEDFTSNYYDGYMSVNHEQLVALQEIGLLAFSGESARCMTLQGDFSADLNNLLVEYGYNRNLETLKANVKLICKLVED